MALNSDEYAALNTMRGSVVVSYAPSFFTSFSAGSGRAMPNNLMEEELIAPSQSLKEDWLCTHETRLSEPPANEPNVLRMQSAMDASPPTLGMLSRRQREVLHLIVQGRSNKEIARALNLALGTVKIHVAALFSKLGVNRRAALAVAARRVSAAGNVDGLYLI